MVVRILLDAGADVNGGEISGSARWAASVAGRELVVRMLLKTGADVNARGNSGNALRAAIDAGWPFGMSRHPRKLVFVHSADLLVQILFACEAIYGVALTLRVRAVELTGGATRLIVHVALVAKQAARVGEALELRALFALTASVV